MAHICWQEFSEGMWQADCPADHHGICEVSGSGSLLLGLYLPPVLQDVAEEQVFMFGFYFKDPVFLVVSKILFRMLVFCETQPALCLLIGQQWRHHYKFISFICPFPYQWKQCHCINDIFFDQCIIIFLNICFGLSRSKGTSRCITVSKKTGNQGCSKDAAFQLVGNSRHQIQTLLQRFPLTNKERQELQPRAERGQCE